MRRWVGPFVIAVLAIVAGRTAPSNALELAPFKDELFGYQNVLEIADGGDFLLVEYDRKRDLEARDLEPRYKVRREYVSLETEAVEQDLVLREGMRRIRYIAVGQTGPGASMIVMFLHGRGADRKAGANDWIHGGNFNRLKNLMMRNGGLYLSPDFANFGRRGADDVKKLLTHYARKSPNAPIVLGCASWGGKICWRLMEDKTIAPLIDGLVFLDSATETDFLRRAAQLSPDERPAIHISNTRRDKIMSYRGPLEFYRRLKGTVPDYPVRIVNFSSGIHGISLRMTDWRQVLNWILSEKQKSGT